MGVDSSRAAVGRKPAHGRRTGTAPARSRRALIRKAWDTIILRGLNVTSRKWGLTGQCDVIEFHRCSDGITLHGREGLWEPKPVEYKRGIPKSDDCDKVQLCGQVLCLEEMLECKINEAYLYYGETRHRESVLITEELRGNVIAMVQEIRQYMKSKHTPSARPGKVCYSCSLKQLCLPKLTKAKRVSEYINSHIGIEV